jgi:hypothetical protein
LDYDNFAKIAFAALSGRSLSCNKIPPAPAFENLTSCRFINRGVRRLSYNSLSLEGRGLG